MGIASAEILCHNSRLSQEEKTRYRALFWVLSLVASNLPDLDVLYAFFLGSNGLGYLLHHRGHTHTFAMVPLQAVLVWGVTYFVYRRRPEIPWQLLFAAVFIALLLHIVADSWNSYGIHPYWPWNNEWIYGDTLLIIEPWIWAFLAPPIFFLTQEKIVRIGMIVFLGVFLLLAWLRSDIPLLLACELTTVVFLVGWIGWRKTGLKALAVGIFCSLLVWSVFWQTRNRILQTLNPENGKEVSLQPFPGNPFCWYLIETKLTNTKYESTSAVFAPYPNLVAAASCPGFLFEGLHEPLKKSELTDTGERRNLKSFSTSRYKFEEIRMNCFVKAYLQFSKAPYWKVTGEKIEIGDLRFERIRAAWTLHFPKDPKNADCPTMLPPWKTRLHSPSLDQS